MILRAKQTGVVFLLTLFSFSCGIYETKTNNTPKLNINAIISNPNAKVTYAQIHQGVIEPSCLRCHDSAHAKGDVVLESFPQVNAQILEVIQDIQTGDMPINGVLSPEQRALFDLWVSQGHTEFGVPTSVPVPTMTPGPTPTATPMPSATPMPVLVPTYQSIRELVFVPKCMNCHGEKGTRHADFPLESYDEMMAEGKMVVKGDPASSTIVKEIEAGKMPTKRSGLPKVTPPELEIIKLWIQNGAQP